MPLWLLADFIVAVHVVYVGVVVLSVPLIMLGSWRKWGWVHNSWFRNIHLAMIAIVVLETVVGMECPLTAWERELRRAAGESAFEGSFLGHWLHELLFFDFPPWVFAIAYISFGVLVIALYVLVPPRVLQRRWQGKEATA
jgi:hypothetical protein